MYRNTASNSTLVFVIDELPIVASGICSFFANSREFVICGQAHSIPEGLKGIGQTKPGVVVTDVQLRRSDGLAWVRDLSLRHPMVKLVVFTAADPSTYALRAIRAGAHGYVSKFDDPAEILKALRSVCRGEVYLPSTQLQDLIRDSAQNGTQPSKDHSLKNLGDRELHVLKLFGSGYSTVDVARSMHISHKTVQTHRRNIMIKLGIPHSTQFVSFASQWMREQAF